MIGGQNCVSSCNGPCPCPYCVCTKKQLSTMPDTPHLTRTKDMIELLAHVKEGMCPGCGMQVVAVVRDATSQVPLCERGCNPPKVPPHKNDKGVTHSSLHYGIVPGQTVNYNLDPEKWSICLLHVNLCIVGGMLQKTLLNRLGRLNDPKQQDDHGTQIYNLLKRNFVYFKLAKLQKKSKNLTKHDLSFKQTSFTGRGGEIVFRLKDQVTCLAHRVYTHILQQTETTNYLFVHTCMHRPTSHKHHSASGSSFRMRSAALGCPT